MALPLKYPSAGCIVEYLEDNAIQIAMVLEESGGKLRLLLPTRRETKANVNRLLPWLGPLYPSSSCRDEAIRILQVHKQAREEKTREIDVFEAWALAQGEMTQAPAFWFAELFENEPDADYIAAFGRALLSCRTHFRFQPPDFLVHDAETVAKKLAEQQARAEKEALVGSGCSFLRLLWDVASRKRELPERQPDWPDENTLGRIENILRSRMINPDSQEDESLWRLLGKGLPDLQHLPFQLLAAWGKIGPHHNFWLDRADFDTGTEWHEPFAAEINELAVIGHCGGSVAATLPDHGDLPFISIDSPKTRDIDDAFYLRPLKNGWELTLALAAPALAWPFGNAFDKKIMRRGTSIYLPEGDLHMLPEALGTDAYSLLARQSRPAFCMRFEIDVEGQYSLPELFAGRVKLAANLAYADVQEVIDAASGNEADNPAAGFAEQLREAHKLALLLEKKRIEKGAVVMRRPDVAIELEDPDGDLRNVIVHLHPDMMPLDAQRLVSEMMVLASSALADWAYEKRIPLIHRTQNVTLPHEYAGIWSEPQDLAKIMRSLIPSILEIDARPHAALGMDRYAPITSPLRRYADLVNEAQVFNYLKEKKPFWDADELGEILGQLSPSLESAGHVQRFRPRYWKLLYFRQQGDKKWWDGVITDENDAFVTVALPAEGLFARGKRNMFDERSCPGMPVRLRLGKINPLYNEIHIQEVMGAE